MQYLPEGSRLHTPENQAALRSVVSMERAMHAGTILEARAVLCDSGHNLTVLKCINRESCGFPEKKEPWASQTAPPRTSL